MRLLVVASMYPHPGLPYSGIFNQNCVEAAASLGHELVVLAPRPWVPPFLSMQPRWKAYTQIPVYAKHGTVTVHRPALVQVPKLNATFQRNQGSFLQMKRVAAKLHREHQFDAVFSFDLGAAGGLAWRLARYLDIPATGWAFGLDVRIPHQSSDANEMRRILKNLDLIYYQSSELLSCAQSYVSDVPLVAPKHVVLPHGIPPMQPAERDTRQRLRKDLGIEEGELLVLFLSRIMKSKGIHELLTAFSAAAKRHPQLKCVAVGESVGFDDSVELRSQMQSAGISDTDFRLLPACRPDEVAEYHACADIFAFPSKSEGMPNALLEAMALGTAAVAFDIPPIMDIVSHGDCLAVVPSFDATAFGQALSELATSPERRQQLAVNGRQVVKEQFNIRSNMQKAMDMLETTISSRRVGSTRADT